MLRQKTIYRFLLMILTIVILIMSCTGKSDSLHLSSKDGKNKIALTLNKNGELFYEVSHENIILIKNSPLGLVCDDQDYTKGLSIREITPVKERREKYELIVGHQSKIDQFFNSRSVILINSEGALITVDLIAGNEGVAFRYRFSENRDKQRIIEKEITGFRIERNGNAWLQPYNKAGQYTPAYEDFYFNVKPGDTIKNPRNESDGFCMPALFNINKENHWLLIAESGTDGSFCGCHLNFDSADGIYRIAFANEEEIVNISADIINNANPRYTLPWTMPWRAIIIGENAGEILLSTMITDLAPASKIADPSWIKAGKASWGWWSHGTDGSASTFDKFSDLAVTFDWEYTLFDANWEKANRDSATLEYAISKEIKPWVWSYAGTYYDVGKRKETLKRFKDMGVEGIKIDFWCSDRQEAINTIYSVFQDAAEQKLMINLHGCTVPRGWHRTWPNFVTAEAVLGTESYFYEPRFPALAAEQNTVLPFTRNVAGPTDYTPVALTIRKYPRLNTAVHELATAMIYSSGVIHFADSDETYKSLPEGIKNLLKKMPASWDQTECLLAEPGKAIVLTRQKDSLFYIVGINGTDKEVPIELDFKKFRDYSDYRLISEGDDPLMNFSVKTLKVKSDWSYTMAPRGGFIIEFNQ